MDTFGSLHLNGYMLRDYKITASKRAEAASHLIKVRDVLHDLKGIDRQVLLLKSFYRMFRDVLEDKSFKHGSLQILISVFNYDTLPKDQYKTIIEHRNIYSSELKLLKKISSNRAVPLYLKRLLAREFLSNLKGTSDLTFIPAYNESKKEFIKEREGFEQEVKVLMEKKGSAKEKDSIPLEALLLILDTPFYSHELKSLLLQARFLSDKERVNLEKKIEVPEKLFKAPYNLHKKIRLGLLLEAYIILAEYFDLPSIMKNSNPPRRKLPYYSSDIIRTIVECSHPGNKENEGTVRDGLKEVLDPDFKG